MRRIPHWVFVGLLALAAGCNGNGTTTFNNATLPPPRTGSSPPTQSAFIITEYPTTDTLLTGLTIASDSNVYAASTVGLDIFAPGSGTIHPSAARVVRPLTWPVIPHANSAPTGAVTSLGPVVSALGSQTPTGTSAVRVREGVTATPFLATFTIATKTFDEAYGTPGDVFEDVAQSADGVPWITANHTGANGVVGYIFTTKAGCTLPVLGDALGSITRGADQFIWFASDPKLNYKTPSQIFRLDPDTGAVVNTYTLGANSLVADLSGGSDGALWYTDAGLNEIGRIGADGTITHFPVPTANSGLLGIANGCDGALWFTERQANKVGRITTAGVVTEYPVPTPNAGLGKIVGCLGNALYFTETHAIGKIAKSSP